MGDGSCCCVCCSTNTDYWGVPNLACAIMNISKLEKDQTLVQACPDPYDEATTEEEQKALLCANIAPKFRRERNPVKGGQCTSTSPEQVGTEQKCYVCENCVMACSGGVVVGCEPEDFCKGIYDCKRPGKPAVWAIQSCLSAVQTKCEWCNAHERSEDPALWDSICTVPRGECYGQPTTVCLTGGPPTTGGDCLYVNFTEEHPSTTPCSETTGADCDLTGQPCGCDSSDPCCSPGVFRYPVEIDLGSDICGISYQGCGVVCEGGGIYHCCKGTPGCGEDNPCAWDCP